MTEQKPNSKLISIMNYLIAKIEQRAEKVAGQSNNHELISKLTFLLVAGMSYEILGEKIITIIAALI